MTQKQPYRTLQVTPASEGVLSVSIDAPPMNLIGPELVRDLVGLLDALESDQHTRVVVLESAVLGQIEVGVGTTPGAGGVQYLARLLGRARAMEAILGADDFSADEAEQYGWINRAVPDSDLDAFVARLAGRIASFPADAVRSAKRVLNELTAPSSDAIRADARRFRQLVVSDPATARTAELFAQGLQIRGPLELDLGDRLGAL